MRNKAYLLYSLGLLLLLSCSCSTKFPKAEAYSRGTLPISVAAAMEQNRVAYESGTDANESMGPLVLQQMRAWNVFQSLEFPAKSASGYQLLVSISGEFDRALGYNKLKRFFVGFSLFLLSPFFDMTATYSHTIEARLLYQGQFVGQYSVPQIVSVVSRAHGPVSRPLNQSDFSEAGKAHAGRLAAALANAISQDRNNILAARQ